MTVCGDDVSDAPGRISTTDYHHHLQITHNSMKVMKLNETEWTMEGTTLQSVILQTHSQTVKSNGIFLSPGNQKKHHL